MSDIFTENPEAKIQGQIQNLFLTLKIVARYNCRANLCNRQENCKESSFSGTSGNDDGDRGGDRGLNSIPRGIGG